MLKPLLGSGRTRALVALVSGVVFATTSPPIDLHAGVLLGLAGFAVSMAGVAPDRRRQGFFYGWCFGLGANLVALRFVPEVILRFTPLPAPAAYLALVLLAAAQALPWALGALATQLLGRRFPALPGPLAFAIGIYIATFLPAIFPWTPAGGLTPWPALVQVAEVVGERGVSFLVAIAAALAAQALGRARVGSR